MWMLYGRNGEQKIFHSTDERQEAIDSGLWRDGHEDFKPAAASGKPLTKTAIMHMNSEERRSILEKKYSIVLPEDAKRADEIKALLKAQNEQDS